MRQTTIKIHVLTPSAFALGGGTGTNDTEYVTVEAWVMDECPGLAIHPAYYSAGSAGGKWHATHILSGKVLGPLFLSQESAEAFVRQVAGLVDWGLPAELLGAALGTAGLRKLQAAEED